MRKIVGGVCALGLALVILLTGARSVRAQDMGTNKKAHAGIADDLLNQWNYTGKQLIDMAADFPENKFNHKATSAQRTFAEQLLHAAGANYIFMDAALRTKAPRDVENPPAKMYQTRTQLLEFVKKSCADGAAAIKRLGDKGLIEETKAPFGNAMETRAALFAEAMEHATNHYGQCVVYYRLNGIVPPESRPRKN
jgi:uncharacterized damage-inducible protein DinB